MTGREYMEFRRAKGSPVKPCPKCGSTDDLDLVLMAENHPHWAAIVCHNCPAEYGGISAGGDLFLTRVDWAKKPENFAKPRRDKSGERLMAVVRTAWGGEPLFCIVCLRDERFLTDTHMEAHHVIEHADGGSDTAENLVPLCRECHELVNWRRKTVRGEQVGKAVADAPG